MTPENRPPGLGRAITAQFGMVLIVGAFVLPYAHLLLTSFKPPTEVLAIPPTFIPSRFELTNYVSALSDPGITRSFVNSLLVAVGGTALTLVLAIPAAYAAAFYGTKLGKAFLMVALIVRMLPPVALAIPIFQAFRQLRLIDTQLGLMLAQTVISLPLVIWLLAAFFESIPQALEEAALIDGCNRLTAMLRVTLPVAGGGIAVAAIFAFLSSWNEFLFALMLTSVNAVTVPLTIANFKSQFGLDWGSMTAMAVMYSLPVIAVTLALQRRIVAGMTFGAVKG
ncbi:Trehalose transport system permease protein SugB [Propionicimonas sp. T2.31MG-18]|uniref:carbohydrate ABC transporter permease n=1 Tax=Propionicimonas sp. T2.31MG-18 TaxID=3157620 RepID=UPI0035EB7D38